MGDAMDIGHEKLKSGKDGGVDELHWLEVTEMVGRVIESRFMRPHINNKITAERTVAINLAVEHSACLP